MVNRLLRLKSKDIKNDACAVGKMFLNLAFQNGHGRRMGHPPLQKYSPLIGQAPPENEKNLTSSQISKISNSN